jgi:hypothetical protein
MPHLLSVGMSISVPDILLGLLIGVVILILGILKKLLFEEF